MVIDTQTRMSAIDAATIAAKSVEPEEYTASIISVISTIKMRAAQTGISLADSDIHVSTYGNSFMVIGNPVIFPFLGEDGRNIHYSACDYDEYWYIDGGNIVSAELPKIAVYCDWLVLRIAYDK